MILSELSVPQTFAEIQIQYKNYKKTIFENWCALSYEDGVKAKDELVSQIRQCAKNQDYKSAVRVCIGASVLSRFTNTRLGICGKFLSSIEPVGNQAATEFICRYIAKFANRAQQSSNFLPHRLKVISEYLIAYRTKDQMNYSLCLLRNIVKFATKALANFAQQFFEYIEPIFYHNRDEIRTSAYTALSTFFRLCPRVEFPAILFKNANINVQKDSAPIPIVHGATLILVAICDAFPSIFNDFSEKAIADFEIIAKSPNVDRNIQHASILMVIALSSLRPHHQIAVNIIWPDPLPDAEHSYYLMFLMRKNPIYFENKIPRLLNTLRNMLDSLDPEISNLGAKLLYEFYNGLPKKFVDNAANIATIISSVNMNETLINVVSELIDRVAPFWKSFMPRVISPIRKLFQSNNETAALRFINICPNFDTRTASEFLPNVTSCLSHTDQTVRKLAPSALLNISKGLSEETQMNCSYKLLQLARTHLSANMRLAALEAFHPPYPRYLSYPRALQFFEVLTKDEDSRVSRAALKILGGLSHHNPSMIYPMFRRVLLDILYICGSTKSIRVQADNTQCLPIIFSSVQAILPIYVPVFLPIALQQLQTNLKSAQQQEEEVSPPLPTVATSAQGSYGSYTSAQGSLDSKRPMNSTTTTWFRPIGTPFQPEQHTDIVTEKKEIDQLTFFGKIFSRTIAVSFIDAIRCICETNFDLIRSSIGEINKILIDALMKSSQKDIIHSILACMEVIVNRLGPLESTKIPKLNTALTSLGARMLSSKVHSAIFKILGQIGAVRPPQLQQNIESANEPIELDLFQVGTEFEYEDYFMYVVVTQLHQLAEEKQWEGLHYSVHTALAQIFSDCKKTPTAKRLFNSYIRIFLNAVRQAPSDTKSDFFEMTRTILSCPTEWLQQYAGNFVQLIEDMWDSQHLADVVSLIPSLSASLKEAFAPYIPRITTLLLDALGHNMTDNHVICGYVLDALTELSNFASNFVFNIVRQITEAIFNPQTKPEVILKSLKALRSIVQTYNTASYGSLIIRSCFYALSLPKDNIKKAAVQVIYSLAATLGPRFAVYKQKSEQAIIAAGFNTSNFEIVANLKEHHKVTDFPFIEVEMKRPPLQPLNPELSIDEDDLLARIYVEW